MIVERIGSGRVLGSSLTGLAIVLSSSVVLAQQPAQQQGAQPPQQQAPGRQSAEQQPAQGPRASEQQPQAAGQQPQAAGQQPQAAGQQEPRTAEQQPRGAEQQPGAAEQQPRASEQQAGRAAPQQEDVEIARAAPPAEQAQPMLTGVRVLQVKHDRIGEFEGLIKELRAAMLESGQQPGFTTWSVELGDVNKYHLVMQLDSFASFAQMEQPPMEPVEWANWLNRIGGTIDSHTMIVGRMRPDMSIMPPEQAQQPPELLMLVSDTVMAGKTREYEAFVRDELLPALQQGDVDAVYANELMFGTEGRTWVYAVPLPGWQALDGPSPLIEALGPEAAQELMLRGDALVDSSEVEVLRFRPDLSIEPTP